MGNDILTWDEVSSSLDVLELGLSGAQIARIQADIELVIDIIEAEGGVTPPSELDEPALEDGSFELPALDPATFEYNPTGSPWTFDGQSGVSRNGSGFTTGNPFAPDGLQVGFIQTDGSITQTFAWPAGTYKVSLRAAQRVVSQTTSQAFAVLIDGQLVGTIPPADGDFDSYMTGGFTVNSGLHTLKFLGTNPNGGDNTAFIDSVEIEPYTPPPPTIPPGPPPPPPPPLPPSPPPPPVSGIPDLTAPTGMIRLASGNVSIGGQTVFINAGGMIGAPDIDWVNREIRVTSSSVHNVIVRYSLPVGAETNGATDATTAPVVTPIGIVYNPWFVSGGTSPEGIPYDGEYSRDNFYGDLGDGLDWHHAICSYYHPPFEHGTRPRWYSQRGLVYTCPLVARQGICPGFVRTRPVGGSPSVPEWGTIGAFTNSGIRGLSCISNTAMVRLLPGSWGGEEAGDGTKDLEASWQRAPLRPPYDTIPTNVYGWSKENPTAATPDPIYIYCFNPRLIDGVWVQKWCAEQAMGGSLWLPGVGLYALVRLGKGGQSYNWQNVGFNPDGTPYPSLVVTFAADCESWICLFPEKADGTFEFDPLWYPAPQIGKPDGVMWNQDGTKIGIFDSRCWNEGGVGATGGAIKFYTVP